jgi:hypothetical protein
MDAYEDIQWDRGYHPAWEFRSITPPYRTRASFTRPGRALAYA